VSTSATNLAGAVHQTRKQ